MRVDREALGLGQAAESLVELALEIVGEMHVGHGSAHLTRQVMVVAHQRLGELESGLVADAGHPADHAFGLEDGEVAVDAARPLLRRPHHDLVDRERTPGFGEHLDEIPPGAGVAARTVREAGGHGLVQDDTFLCVRRHPTSVVPKMSMVPVLDSE